MKNKYRNILNTLCALILMFGMMLGNFQTGKAQSEIGWTTPVNLSLSGIATAPLMVVDSEGVIHVIWLDAVDGYKYSQSVDGVKWSAPFSVTFPFDPEDAPPTLLADTKGFVHVFWIDKRGGLNYGRTPSIDFGVPSKWSKVNLSINVSTFDVALDSLGKIHIAYIENATNSNGQAGVYYRQAVSGDSWSEPQKIYTSEYFRMTTLENAYVRVAVADQFDKQKIYISWDNRPLKRIYIANSDDAGNTWSEPEKIKGPDDTGSFNSPFNVSVWVVGENLLLMWQVGILGASKCSVYSQWSKDGGNSWEDTMILFGGTIACPTDIRFFSDEDGKVAVLLNDPYDPVLVAWNGIDWSAPQSQIKLSPLFNPATYDAISLGCRQNIIYKDILFVVGCDQAGGGDVWLLSRKLIPLDKWFSSNSLWDEPIVLEQDGQEISNLFSVPDSNGNIHAVWAETPLNGEDFKPFIQYSRWDGDQWSKPERIIENLNGIPLQLTLYFDTQNRLMLAWVDGSSGDVLFAWSNPNQLGFVTDWKEPTILPSPSQLNSSPDIVVDATGRIVVTYSVPYNENRGIYLVESTNNGVTWSPYIKAFDGIRAQWEQVDHPEIALSGDGSLQLIFTRRAGLDSHPAGLYYSRSLDGGVSWTEPQVISEGKIFWSDIVAYGDQMVLRLWQESNDLVVANLSQVSQDGGATWGQLLEVTGVSEDIPLVALASNSIGQLYFIQLAKKNVTGFLTADKFVLQGSSWNGNNWNSDSSTELRIKGQGISYSLTAGLTSKSYLGVLISSGYSDSKGKVVNEIISLNRFLGDTNIQSRVTPGVISTLVFAPSETINILADATKTPMVDLALLNNTNDSWESITNNIVGISLIIGVAIVAFLLFVRRKPRIKEEVQDNE